MPSVLNEATQFTDESTSELINNGYIYIGEQNLDAKLNPITIYANRALSTVLANPQRTGPDGRSVNKIFIPAEYSMKIEDSANVQKLNYLDLGEANEFQTPDSIADLRLAVITNGIASTKGYYEPGGGGASDYYWNSTSTATDNGGTIIKATAVVTGRWLMIYTSPIHAKQFGCTGDGATDDSSFFEKAIASGEEVDISGSDIELSTSITAPLGVHVSSDGTGRLSGGDRTGINVTTSHIELDNIEIDDWNDGTDDNKTNYTTTFIRVTASGQFTRVILNKVVSDSCRSIVSAGSVSDDFTSDVTIKTDLLSVTNCTISNSSVPVNWRSLCSKDVCTNNDYTNIIGAGREVSAHKCFLDGIAYNSSSYLACKNHYIVGNTFDTIVNRTTTGDSTAGNNYEAHAIIISGIYAQISHNIIVDCTGNDYDAEGIYSKTRYCHVHDNILIDSCGGEAAINMKGINDDGIITGTSPFGDGSSVKNNTIIFTNYTYMNDVTSVDLAGVLTGISATATEGMEISGNKIYGANSNDILINGFEDSDNEGVSVHNNTSFLFRGANSIIFRGGFKNPSMRNNKCLNPTIPATLSAFHAFRFLSVSARGNLNTNLVCEGNSLVCDISDGRVDSKVVSLVFADVVDYDIEGLTIGDNIWDVTIASATPDIRPIYLVSSTGGKSISGLKMTPNTYRQTLATYPHYFTGSNYDDFVIEDEVTHSIAAVTITALQLPTITGKSLNIDFTHDANTSTDGAVATQRTIGNHYYNAGTAATGNQANLYAYDNILSGGPFFSASGIFMRIRILGVAAVMSSRLKFRASSH